MFGLGLPETIIVLIIVLLVFGAGKLPDIMGSLGKAIRNFKKSVRGPDHEDPRTLTRHNKGPEI